MPKIVLVLVALCIVAQIHSKRIFDWENIDTLVVVATNDIHGHALPKQRRLGDTNEVYKAGGLQYVGGLLEILRQEVGRRNVVYVDAGDQFQGGLEADKRISGGKIMNEYFRLAEVDASAVGNHQFDEGPEYLKAYITRGETGYLSSNFKFKGEAKDNSLSKIIKSQIVTKGNGIKIGIIGLTTIQTTQTSPSFIGGLMKGFTLAPYKQPIEEESNRLKKDGAHIIVLLSHVGDRCENQSTRLQLLTSSSSQQSCQGDILNLLSQLPSGTIDAVVQGHQHQIVHYYYKDIPIVSTTSGGQYLNLIYLQFNRVTRKLQHTFIEGPIAVCEKVFERLKTCEYVNEIERKSAGELMDWKFHGRRVVPDQRMKEAFSRWESQMDEYKKAVVQNQVDFTANMDRNNLMYSLASTLMFKSVPGSDFSLLNPGLVRSFWSPQIITSKDLFQTFPFQNKIQSFNITGANLKTMLRILESKELLPVYCKGLDMTVGTSPKRLVQVTLEDGGEIVDERLYKGVTTSFMLAGGNSMGEVIRQGVAFGNIVSHGNQRDLFSEVLRSMKRVTLEDTSVFKSVKMTLVD